MHCSMIEFIRGARPASRSGERTDDVPGKPATREVGGRVGEAGARHADQSGAVKKAPPGGSAFAHRDALFYAEPGAGWSGDAYVNVPNPGMLD
jgi:hypothetical protein